MKTKFKSQRKGAVLATVTVVSVMMVVIIGAATHLVSQTNTRTNVEYRKKQAYYVASSCLRAFVSETTSFSEKAGNTDEEIMEQINQLKRIAKSGQTVEVKIQEAEHESDDVSDSQPRWKNAKCEIKVEPTSKESGNLNSLKVISTATYLGQEKTVVAYLNCTPLQMHTYTPKALEIIGTNGGIEDKFNNIFVYGSTAATDKESHNKNAIYKINHNDCTIYGDTDINGSCTIQNQNRFKNNPYYYPGVDDTKGCVLNVSRSLVFNANQPTFEPTIDKPIGDNDRNPQITEFNYNYLNVREATVLLCENAFIGKDDAYSVDTYASYLYIGNYSNLDSHVRTAMGSTCEQGVDAYWGDKGMASQPFGTGNENKFHGNVYVYNLDAVFNGDMVVTGINNHFYGDIYLEGDLYLSGIALSQFDVKGNIYLKKDHHIYNCNRTTDASGVPIKPDSSHEIENTLGNYHINDDWTTIPRANRPSFPVLETTEKYYYYPEHLLCEAGHKTTVSTIEGQYKGMYEADGKTISSSVKSATDSSFANTDETEFTGENGAVFKPDYIVTNNCYIEKLDNKKILIDVDEAHRLHGLDNVVVILKDGGSTGNQNVILVKNRDIGSDEEGARFCYFVSDSGVGTTYDEYGDTGTEVSTYDHSSFKTPTFSFKGTREVLMDLDAFLNCDVYTETGVAQGNGGSLNPTADTSYPGYPLPPNNIIMLFTEGSTLDIIESNIVFQASIYMPRATYHTTNKGGMCQIDPYFSNTKMDGLAVIGNLICHNYQVDAGNRNAIVYNEVSSYSMLAIIKGLGDEHASESFRLERYAAS